MEKGEPTMEFLTFSFIINIKACYIYYTMNVLVNVIIFLIVLFLYIHITNHFKKSEDLEIYEMDYSTNIHLQEVCDIKQPMLFNYNSVHPEFFENITFENLLEQGSHDVKIKDINDYWIEDIVAVDYVVLPFQSSQNLMKTDTKAKYFSENNSDFIQDSGFFADFKENDDFLKPTFTMFSKYDILFGSKNNITPLRYHTHYRYFLAVNSGKITVKLTPWKSSKYLHPIKDFENYEFRSPINVWNPQKQFQNDMEKLKFLEFTVQPGSIVYIPPFWWYSIKFSNQSDSLVSTFTYNSIMNCVSNLPNYGLYYLQQANIQKKVTKTLEIKPEDNNDVENII